MAHRYWRLNESMGYAGTDSSEDIDACDYLGKSEPELSEMTDEEIEEILSKWAYESACEKVEAWVEKIDNPDDI